MSVKSIPLQLKLRGDTQIENITKRVADAVCGGAVLLKRTGQFLADRAERS